MATGGGLGRGTGRGLGILQQLKQKDKAEEVEKEEERRISPPPVSASVAPEKPKLVSDEKLKSINIKFNFN